MELTEVECERMGYLDGILLNMVMNRRII